MRRENKTRGSLAGGTLGCWLVLALFGCGDEAENAPVEKPVLACTPGTSFTCVKGSCSGRQQCLSDGSGYTPCVCNSELPQAGMGGQLDASVDGRVPDAEAPSSDASAGDAGPTPQASDEICGNGEDDDDNGDVDCADDACTALSCTPQAPSGFAGPIVIHTGAGAPDDCDAVFSAEAFRAGEDPSGAAATCSSCECTPVGTGCAAQVHFDTSTSPGCGGTPCETPVSGSCVQISPPCLNGVATASLRTKLPASTLGCTPSPQVAVKQSAGFAIEVLACALPDAQRDGCAQDQVCVPAAPATFEDTLCVWQAGDVACPASVYTEKSVYYRELVDTRTCTACSCAGPECSYGWQVFGADDTSCSTPLVALTLEDQCVQVSPSEGQLRVGATITPVGECSSSGGKPQGAVSGGDPVTVCCAP